PAVVGPPVFDVDDPRLARAAWSRLAEPGDEVAVALVDQLGPGPALAWLYEAVRDPAQARRALVGLAEAGGAGAVDDGEGAAPDPLAVDGVVGVLPADRATAGADRDVRSRAVARLLRAVARWAPRLDGLDPRRELRVLERLGGQLLVPGDAGWPVGLDDLGPVRPLALWVRGNRHLAAPPERSARPEQHTSEL